MGLKIDQRLLTEEERKLQEIVKQIRSLGTNEQLENDFRVAWKNALDKLNHDNPYKTYGEIFRMLDCVYEQAWNG